MRQLEKALKHSEVLTWALANSHCCITEVPSWVIMALLEDIACHNCQVVEQLVMGLDGSQGLVMEESYLEGAVEKLMTNVLLSSLYEDGYIEIARGLADEPRLFDFHHEFDVTVSLTSSGEKAQVWEELELFKTTRQVSVH